MDEFDMMQESILWPWIDDESLDVQDYDDYEHYNDETDEENYE